MDWHESSFWNSHAATLCKALIFVVLLKRHNILDCCTGGLMRGTMAKMSSFTDNAENQRKGQGCRWWISILEFHHYIPPYTQSPFRQRKQGTLMSPYMHLLGIASLCIHADEFGLEKECTIVNGVTARGQNRYNIKMSWITKPKKRIVTKPLHGQSWLLFAQYNIYLALWTK